MEIERPTSPRMSSNLVANDGSSSSSYHNMILGGAKLSSLSVGNTLASVVEEMESGRMSASSESLHYGKKLHLHDFILEKDLGEGAYAFVKQVRYRTDPPERPPLAMKMVIKSKLRADCILHDFDTGYSLPVELFALRHLREYPHPNIVSMVDAFEDALYYYILMPMHGRGEDLFETIERHQDFLPSDRVARIFSQIAMAVAHLHTVLGIIHRDIKDENVIIDEHDHIQLIDFGSSAYYLRGADFAQPDIPLTEADVRCGKRMSRYSIYYGTIDYAPPEVLRGESYDGPQQDIWALGVLLYVLAFKEVPFRSHIDILEHRLRLPFEPTPQIATMIERLLQPDPAARPSAHELAHDPWIVENYKLVLRETVKKQNGDADKDSDITIEERGDMTSVA